MFLGLEGSANKIGIGVFDGDSILFNERKTYTGPIGEGFMPKEVAKHHRETVCDLLSQAFSVCKPISLTAVCYTRGPGMAPSLISVAIAARLIALLAKKPLVPVNHCIAHIEMGRFETGAVNPVILYVSGGNTQVIGFCNGKYRILGETIDIALGNCLDRAARLLDITNYPSPGYNIEQEAKRGKVLLDLPYSVKGMDVAFSGILSSIADISRNKHISKGDICFTLQETTFSMLLEITERALAHFESSEVLIVGGVGCIITYNSLGNLRLQEMMSKMIVQRGGRLFAMNDNYCIDNGAMIAYTGSLYYAKDGTTQINKSNCLQRFRTDSEFIAWR